MRRPSYSSYLYPTPVISRCSTGHGTSSAFSASAQPNEDWTKIADLAERRRIQNRIAQRNYRKKQRRRMEDLERRAGSTSASPPATYQEPVSSTLDLRDDRLSSPERRGLEQYIKQEDIPLSRYSPSPPLDNGQQSYVSSLLTARPTSVSPPPFGCTVYPAPEEPTMYQAYPQHATYTAMPTYNVAEMPLQPQFLPQLPINYGSTAGTLKYESFYSEEESMSPFSINYAAMAGTGLAINQAMHHQSSRTPPLSDTFESSLGGSPVESRIMFPLTPSSIPASPPIHFS